MSDTSDPGQDHDQRLKVLLKEFFEQFFRCFFAEWADRFDFGTVTWLDKEVFLAPPQGEKRHLDLVARLQVRPGAPPLRPGVTDLIALVHVEVEARDSVQPLRPRMFDYYTQLRRDGGLPVLPIGLYLRVGLDGTGWDAYEEYFWEQRLLRFEYAYVGLPALDAEAYSTSEHLLAVALTSLMRTPPARRVELHAEGLKRIALSGENDLRRYLLAECLEAYAEFDEAERQQFQALLDTETYQEARPIMMTTFERGRAVGRQEGKQEGKLEGKQEGKLEALQETALSVLDAKFGALSPSVQHRIAGLSLDDLRQLMRRLIQANSLKELNLEE